MTKDIYKDVVTVSDSGDYYNVDIRDLDHNIGYEFTLLFDDPKEGVKSGSSGSYDWYMFQLGVKGKRIGAFMYGSFKSDEKGVSLAEKLIYYGTGDKIAFTKKEGKFGKQNKRFTYWEIENTGHVDLSEDDLAAFKNPEGSTVEATPKDRVTNVLIKEMLEGNGMDSNLRNVKNVKAGVKDLTIANIQAFIDENK